MNISLTEEGKKMPFSEYKKRFGKFYSPKDDIKADYERLTGRKVGTKSADKPSKKI